MALESKQHVYIGILARKGFNVGAMFAQTYLKLPVLHRILHHLFAWKFYHFTCLAIMEGYIVKITEYEYDKYFSISEWKKPGRT